MTDESRTIPLTVFFRLLLYFRSSIRQQFFHQVMPIKIALPKCFLGFS